LFKGQVQRFFNIRNWSASELVVFLHFSRNQQDGSGFYSFLESDQKTNDWYLQLFYLTFRLKG